MANVLRKADVCGSLGTDAEPHGSGSDKDQSPLGERDSGLDEAMDGMKKHLKLRSLRQILLGLDGDGRCPDEADASSNATDKALLSLNGWAEEFALALDSSRGASWDEPACASLSTLISNIGQLPEGQQSAACAFALKAIKSLDGLSPAAMAMLAETSMELFLAKGRQEAYGLVIDIIHALSGEQFAIVAPKLLDRMEKLKLSDLLHLTNSVLERAAARMYDRKKVSGQLWT
ncbi:MAG: hypothetical protein JWP38_773 [Herbaspirillum sp.]|jgi:hypothetical protein|nr:hypothetical protein [Herbaspirillum sp.]